MILPALLAGAALGGGLLVLVRATVASPVPNLQRALTELYEPPATDGLDAVRARWSRVAIRALRLGGRDLATARRDLAVTGTTLERHAVAKLGFAVAGAALPVLAAVVWRLAAIDVPLGPVVLLAAGAAVVGFLVPDGILARKAQERRREFRYGLGLWLELVVIVLAGGGGVQTALVDASDAGTGWVFQELRRTLNEARLQRRSPWAALDGLADRIGSVELAELASSVELAGASGARVRESLRAKAASVRDHELAETESEALAASERMGGPMVGMFFGLILLIGYPAMATVLAL